MSTEQPSDQDHTHLLTVFSVSAGMVGVCLTAIGLIQVMTSLRQINTLCDEVLVFDALLFLSSSVTSYWALHHRFKRHRLMMRRLVDTLLMLGIVLMVVVCGMIAYAITELPQQENQGQTVEVRSTPEPAGPGIAAQLQFRA